MQQERQPQYPFLYSLQGYRYCNLFLDLDRPTEARERALKAIEIAIRNNWLLNIGLDHLTLGRACLRLGDLVNAATHLDQAVGFLRKAGNQDHLQRGLLARAAFLREQGQFDAARRDLDEAMELAER